MEIRIVVVVTAVLACLLRPSERKFSKNERFFLGAFGRGTGFVAENSESTQRLALHVPLLCSFRFLPAHVCRMQLPILEPRDCFSRQAEGLASAAKILELWASCLERGKKTSTCENHTLRKQLYVLLVANERRPPHWTHKANSMTNKIQLDLVTIVIRVFNLLP